MAVDDNNGARKVVQGRRVRHYNYEPMLEPVIRADAQGAVPIIEAQIRSTRRKRTCGSYVFVAPNGDAYVISEESPAAERWVKERLTWMVGLYCPKKVTLSAPHCLGEVVDLDLDGLAGDIAEHLAGLAQANVEARVA